MSSNLESLLDRAVDVMSALHRSIEPDLDHPDIPGIVPAAAMRTFVDALADIDRERCQLRRGDETTSKGERALKALDILGRRVYCSQDFPNWCDHDGECQLGNDDRMECTCGLSEWLREYGDLLGISLLSAPPRAGKETTTNPRDEDLEDPRIVGY